jgi:hypothetical protein
MVFCSCNISVFFNTTCWGTAGSNIESVLVTEEAVLGMSQPDFSYAEVGSILYPTTSKKKLTKNHYRIKITEKTLLAFRQSPNISA